MTMWQRLTDGARAAIRAAQEETAHRGMRTLETEHLLLALLRGNTVTACLLADLGIDCDEMRAAIEQQIEHSDDHVAATDDMTLACSAKKVIDLAFTEAWALGGSHVREVWASGGSYVGAEHLLLGIIAKGEGLAATVLAASGVDLDRARGAVAKLDDRTSKVGDTPVDLC